MTKEFVKDEDGFWTCDCERFTEMSLARNLTIKHYEDDTPIYYVNEDEDFKLMEHEYVDGMLLERVKNSNRITVNDNIIEIFDKDYTKDKEDSVNTSEISEVTLTPEEFESRLEDTEFFDITPDRIYKKLLTIEYRLRKMENAKDSSNEEEVKTDESVKDKLSKLVGTKIHYDKIRDCFPPEARSSFTLKEAEHGLPEYDWLDNPPKVYLADSDYTELYYIVVMYGTIIETR